MIVLDDADVRRLLTPGMAVGAIRRTLTAQRAGRLSAPPRVRAQLAGGALLVTAGRIEGLGYAAFLFAGVT